MPDRLPLMPPDGPDAGGASDSDAVARPPEPTVAQRAHEILDSVTDAFFAVDGAWRFTYLNRHAQRLFAADASPLIGENLWEAHPALAGTELEHAYRKAAAEHVASTLTAFYPDHERWYEVHVYPASDGIAVSFRDATDRISAGQQLRDGESRYPQAPDAAPTAAEASAGEATLRESHHVLALAMRGGRMGAWSRNLVTDDVWWSRELEELFGLPPGGFAGTLDGFERFVHEEDAPALRAAVNAAIASRTDYMIEFRFRTASGEWRWMDGRGRAVYAPDGTPTMLYGLGIDVTERKRWEEALARARDAAETANRVKDQFLATLSHELRTPLNAILGYARMLLSGAIAPEKRDHAVKVIERNAYVQVQLVEDLLDVSRISSGKIRLDPETLPMAVPLREAIESARPAADARQIAIVVDIAPAAADVHADPMRLQQVFRNLLSNAVKFTPRGGVIRVTARHDDDVVEVAVSDSGIGIPADFLPHVFEPFRQADGRLSRDHGGLGLGLSISRQLIELHGGTIGAASPGPGQGTTFTVRLPRKR